MKYDILIKNGTVLDGKSVKEYQADVGIKDGKIKSIGKLGRARAEQVIDARQRMVAPGFIDIQNHSDSYFTLIDNPSQNSLIAQGITTIVVGQCGTSLAPLPRPEALRSVQKWHPVRGANINWLTFPEYLETMSGYKLGPNVASLIGHSTIRRGILGDQFRAATKEEIKIMDKIIADGFEAGAAGLSLGLAYAHEVNSSAKELETAAKRAAGDGKLLSIHLRSDGISAVQAVEEVLELALNAGARLKISHLKVRNDPGEELMHQALAAIDRTYQQGLKVYFDFYPYTTSWTVLYTYLPKWAYEGGKKAILKNLRDKSIRPKILSYLKSQQTDFGSIMIATSEINPSMVGKTIGQIALNQETSNEQAMLNVLEATETQAIVFDHNLREKDIELAMRHPLGMVATDGAGYGFEFSAERGLVHPRCFGAMPKFLAMVREKHVIPLPEAIKKITSRPAMVAGIQKRGVLEEGNFADAVVFDPSSVDSRSTYENPNHESDGIDHVIVNGKSSYSKGNPVVQANGKVIKI